MKVGLGPVVCPSCMIFVDTEHMSHTLWRCSSCGTDALEYLWLFTEEEQRQIHTNSKFIRFVEGRDEQSST